jgi:hypothetical protein
MQIQADSSTSRVCKRPLPAAAWMACMLVAGWTIPAAAAPKTDVIVLVNGDRITGEIKGLEYNQLKVSTDHMGTVYIEWDKIARVQTDQFLLLERGDGSRYYGQLAAPDQDAQLAVRRTADGKAEPVAMSTVVRAQPIEGGDFIDRLDGYVSAGFDLSQSGDNTTFNFAGGLSSRSRVREWSLDGTADLTDDSARRTERYDLSGVNRRLLQGQNFYQGQLSFTRNTELDLNLRSQFGGGLGRYFVRSNSMEWRAGAGLAYTHENYQSEGAFDSIELVLATDFSVFRYDFPETDIGGSLALYPSLTKSGRYRAEGDVHAAYEFVDDLYFELRMYGSYDSEPPGEVDAPSGDYGVVTSLGYKF